LPGKHIAWAVDGAMQTFTTGWSETRRRLQSVRRASPSATRMD